MSNFCHIAPTAHLNLVKDRPIHLVLAHLIETDKTYADFYKEEAASGSTIIMDNSAFEMYKQGRPMYSAEKLMDMGNLVNADYIALPDYPGEDSNKTINAAKHWAPLFKQNGFKTFFIPQSEIGEVDDLVQSFMWAATDGKSLIDYIGYSILAIPNAFGVEKDNKLQRYVSRARFVEILHDWGFFKLSRTQRHHFLGMVDGPNEIQLIKQVLPFELDSWDSSAAIWAGLNNIEFDMSPTGLINGKFEKEVDFNAEILDPEAIEKAENNMIYIDNLWTSFTLEQAW